MPVNTKPASSHLNGDIPVGRMRKFTVDEYHSMAKAGVFKDGDPFELLEGWIVRKMTRNVPHDQAIELVDEQFSPLLPTPWRLRIQCAITTEDSEPEPDVGVVRGGPRSRPGRHPGPRDIAMLVEVADASLEQDRGPKARIYSRAGIGIYWIVNLVDSQVEVYTEPTGRRTQHPRYRRQTIYGVNDSVPLVIEGKEIGRIAVRDILP